MRTVAVFEASWNWRAAQCAKTNTGCDIPKIYAFASREAGDNQFARGGRVLQKGFRLLDFTLRYLGCRHGWRCIIRRHDFVSWRRKRDEAGRSSQDAMIEMEAMTVRRLACASVPGQFAPLRVFGA